jgi:hypothetical protein
VGEGCQNSQRVPFRSTVIGVRTFWIALGVYRLLLLPVTLVLVAAAILLPIGVGVHTLQRILLVLWVIVIIPPLANTVYEGWKKLSAR